MTTVLPAAHLPSALLAARAAVSLDRALGASAVRLAALPDRDLTAVELRALAAAVAANPARWRAQVRFNDQHRHYVSLHRDAHLDVWLLCWTPANDTGWHDHDVSSGAVAVATGCLTEHNLTVGGPTVSDGARHTDVPAGSAFCFGPEHIHRLTGRDRGSVSVHAYSPPLARMGQYSLGPGGVLSRLPMSYAEELRPLDELR